MPISGLVVVCQSLELLEEKVVQSLSRHPNIVLGERCGNQLAIVVDTESKEEDIKVENWICNLPGVQEIKIAFIGFGDDQHWS